MSLDEALPLPNATGVTNTTEEFTVEVNGVPEIQIDSSNPELTNITLGNEEANSNIIIAGGLQFGVTHISDTTTAYDLKGNDYLLSAETVTLDDINLPAAADNPGRKFIVFRQFAGASPLNINAFGTDTIDGLGSVNIQTVDVHAELISDGIDRWVLT
jgi:hypothetical protein